jgi:hypothetical protein
MEWAILVVVATVGIVTVQAVFQVGHTIGKRLDVLQEKIDSLAGKIKERVK